MKRIASLLFLLFCGSAQAYTLIGSSVSLPTPVSIRQYGANGDDISLDTAAIVSALAANRAVYFPQGTYLTDTTFTITGQTVLGDGKGRTIFKRSTGAGTIFIVTGSATIQGCTLDGNNLAGSVLISSGSQRALYKDLELKNVGATDYAMRFWDGDNEWITSENIEFRNNYGNMWIETLYYSRFFGTKMFDNTSGYNITFSSTNSNHGVNDIKFNDTYIQGGKGIFAKGVSAIRDVTFDGLRVRINTFTEPWFQSYYAGAGGEVAQVTFKNFSLLQTVNLVGTPLFYLNTYQHTFENLHIRNAVGSADWSVFGDLGTDNLTLRNVEVESTNHFIFFSTDSTGGFDTYAENINWTQGVRGSVAWGNPSVTDDRASNHVTVRNSNMDNSIATSTFKAGGFIFEHIKGNLDLSQSTGTNSAFDVTVGTVSDPNSTLLGTVLSSSTIITSTSGANGSFFDVGNLTIPAGTWLLWGEIGYTANGATFASVNTRIGVGTVPGHSSTGMTQGQNYLINGADRPTTFTQTGLALPPWKTTITVSTRYYLKGLISDYSAGQPLAGGTLYAQRIENQP